MRHITAGLLARLDHARAFRKLAPYAIDLDIEHGRSCRSLAHRSILFFLLLRTECEVRFFAHHRGSIIKTVAERFQQPNKHIDDLNQLVFAGSTRAFVVNLRETKTSRLAADSRADPRAISKNRARSFLENFPFPSAILSGMLVAARSSWSFAATELRNSPTHSLKASDS